nr:MAG TPA: hypothetical protein [Caudoviricetes sp.]
MFVHINVRDSAESNTCANTIALIRVDRRRGR